MTDPALTDVMAGIRAGTIDGNALVSAFRASMLLLPTLANRSVATSQLHEITWIIAFTSEYQLALYTQARGGADRHWPYVAMIGAWILDDVLPSLNTPTGVALDVAGEQPIMLPPVHGIVPASAAVA